jgi:hypothetical protein
VPKGSDSMILFWEVKHFKVSMLGGMSTVSEKIMMNQPSFNTLNYGYLLGMKVNKYFKR